MNLIFQVLSALVLAFLCGWFFPEFSVQIGVIGTVFIRLLKMLVVPLVTFSLISGVLSAGQTKILSRVGFRTFFFYILTSFMAIVTGLVLVNLIRPGAGQVLKQGLEVPPVMLESTPSLGDIVLRMIPTNMVQSFAQTDMLGIIFFSLFFGFCCLFLPEDKKKLLTSGIECISEAMMTMASFVMKLTPLGVFGLLAYSVGEAQIQGSLWTLISSVGLYMLTVLLALLIHMFFNLFFFLFSVAKVNPFSYFKKLLSPLLTAFSTASSSATLPLTMRTIEENTQIPSYVSRFSLPLGATINMDGTALYECVAALFIAQCYGVSLGWEQQVLVVVTSLLASIGAAGIPMAGLVMMSVILTAVGLPLEGVGLILAVDRILDMFRTAVNVWSDSCVCAFISQLEGVRPIES